MSRSREFSSHSCLKERDSSSSLPRGYTALAPENDADPCIARSSNATDPSSATASRLRLRLPLSSSADEALKQPFSRCGMLGLRKRAEGDFAEFASTGISDNYVRCKSRMFLPVSCPAGVLSSRFAKTSSRRPKTFP